MIKNIKRIGIIFLAVAIVCLMVIGCLSVNNNGNVTLFGSSNQDFSAQGYNSGNNGSGISNDTITSDGEVEEQEETFDFELGVTGKTMEESWKEAVAEALLPENSGKTIKVRLLKDWIASLNDDYMTSFGTDTTEKAFVEGTINVPEGANIELHLNEKKIDRGLFRPRQNGHVITIAGTLTIRDTDTAMSKLYSIYEQSPTLLASVKNVGKITGGASDSSGGGIVLLEDSHLIVKGGMICQNRAGNSGGGINVKLATLDFYDGVVNNNTAPNSLAIGGGVSVVGSEANIYGGIFANNETEYHGGGLAVDNYVISSSNFVESNVTIKNGIFVNNKARYGAVSVYRSMLEIYDCKVIDNVAINTGAGIIAWDLATLKMYGGLVSNNRAEYGLGGISTEETSGGAVMVGRTSSFTMEGGEISNNELINSASSTCNGGGIGGQQNARILLLGGVIKNNKIIDLGGAESLGGGVCNLTNTGELAIGGDLQVYSNEVNGNPSDIFLYEGQKLNVNKPLINNQDFCTIGIQLANSYGNVVFTNGFSANNTMTPSNFFFNSVGGKIANLSNSEVMFENTLVSEKYDYIYYENNIRKSYKDNNLTHALNDFEKIKYVNNGLLVLGNIESYTSINEFVSNINFDTTNIKLINSQGVWVLDKGVLNEDIGITVNMLADENELSVGTGWIVETYSESGDIIETIYLSVLGDLTGDGKVNSADLNYLRQLVISDNMFDSLDIKPYLQLATLIVNKNGISSGDADILWQVVLGNIDIRYFI